MADSHEVIPLQVQLQMTTENEIINQHLLQENRHIAGMKVLREENREQCIGERNKEKWRRKK